MAQDRIAAVFFDWRGSAKDGDNGGPWSLRLDELELAGESSSITRLDGWRPPVPPVRGDDDRAVKFAQGVELAARLRDRDVDAETLVIPGEEHRFPRHATCFDVHTRTLEFVARTLEP